MNVTIIDNTPARSFGLKASLENIQGVSIKEFYEINDTIADNGSKLFLIHKGNDNIETFVPKVNSDNFIVFFSGGGIAQNIDGIIYSDKMFNLPDVFNAGNEEQALNRIGQIVEVLKKDNNATNAISEIKEVLGFDEAIENPLKKLATSLPFDYVYGNDADLRNAKSELDKAVRQRLNK
jgi:hypothetical protein